ncbi:hypothetical protein [Streptomyces sp. JW3]|uniref:hypothetical protein n=1 Tax=Streptomyces sp. JW3 TaxID=3456955 RepID=UPI003FA4D2BC
MLSFALLVLFALTLLWCSSYALSRTHGSAVWFLNWGAAAVAVLAALAAPKMTDALAKRNRPVRRTSASYEAQVRSALTEIAQDEAEDALGLATSLLARSRLPDVPPLETAAATAQGLTDIFSALGPPPLGIRRKYSGGGSGSGDGVGAGPRGSSA